FGGTSCAAPNLAGIASLVWSANPNLNAAQVRAILESTALDMGDAGRDNTFGSGLVDAGTAVRRAVALGRDYALASLALKPLPYLMGNAGQEAPPDLQSLETEYTVVEQKVQTAQDALAAAEKAVTDRSADLAKAQARFDLAQQSLLAYQGKVALKEAAQL